MVEEEETKDRLKMVADWKAVVKKKIMSEWVERWNEGLCAKAKTGVYVILKNLPMFEEYLRGDEYLNGGLLRLR